MIRWADEERLGLWPDELLAVDLGVSRQSVLRARQRLGLGDMRPEPRDDFVCAEVEAALEADPPDLDRAQELLRLRALARAVRAGEGEGR